MNKDPFENDPLCSERPQRNYFVETQIFVKALVIKLGFPMECLDDPLP